MEPLRIVTPESYVAHHGHPWYAADGMMRPRPRASSSSARPPAYVCPTPRRTHTTAGHAYPEGYRDGHRTDHRAHAAHTYRVVEEEIAEMSRQNEETVRWILRQQERDTRERLMSAASGMDYKYRHILDDLEVDMARGVHFPKLKSDRRDRYGGARFAVEMVNVIDEEIKRLQARRREAERYREAYERRKAVEEERDRDRRRQRQERGRAEREQAERAAWQEYESKWTSLMSNESSSDELTFELIPWPQITPPKSVDDIRPARIAMFLLSSQHSAGQSKKERIRTALRRWHPDRFSKILARVSEEDKAKVEEVAGAVARCLNQLLERST